MTTSLVDTEAKARITRLERSFLGSIGAMLSYLRRTPFLGSACVVLLLVGGVRGQGSSLDPSSYSNVEEFVPKHLSFNMEIDFEQSVVSGTVTHTMEALTNDMTTVYMDVWDGLTVKSAEFAVDEASRSSCPTNFMVMSFAITTPNPNIGNALAVELPCSVPSGTIFYLKFAYETTPDTTALSWLTPEQTAGKQLPYMYSLCQMNFCRDFAPMMDTPSQKITYNATVVAPSQFVVRMSANTTSTEMYNETHTISTFDAAIKIPSYLIAIVVGDLVESDLDERVSIISEPTYIDSAVEEFSELPEILDIAEAYLTPYAWGRYSIVIMPPSFPWGVRMGMTCVLDCLHK
jgi:leukotriene-A4 hydrolase